MSRKQKIAELNDLLRETFLTGQVFLTSGIHALDDETKQEVLTKVRCYDTFTPDNDPHQEHDFGSFEIKDQRFFWKIDYYDETFQYLSPDPADPKVTKRVLTIMLAEEY